MIAQEQLLTPNLIVPGTRSTYRILKLVGRGGMGAVYRAERTADNTIWALKEMRPPPATPPDEVEENRNLFEQEAKLLASLSHPNIPVLADYFTFDGRPVMVMEFIDGETLEDRMLQTNAPFPEQQALGFGIQLCRVLHYLHTQQPPIIYRDLKPPNIMVTRANGVMKLIDFGVARTHKKGKSKDTIAMGSAGYAPPEQYGRGQTDARSDVYALGATLLHLLTNLPPVPLQTPAVGYIGRFNPSVSSKTEQVIIKAMDLEREKRFGSCAEMERALLACLTAPYVDPTEQIAIPPIVPPTPHIPAAPAAPVPPTPHVPAAPAAPVPPAAPPVCADVVCAGCASYPRCASCPCAVGCAGQHRLRQLRLHQQAECPLLRQLWLTLATCPEPPARPPQYSLAAWDVAGSNRRTDAAVPDWAARS